MKELLNNKVFLGYLFAIAATALWSGNFIVARDLSDSIPPISIAFWRWTVAFLFFTPFALKRFIKDWKLLKSHIPYIVVTGFIGVTLFNTLIYIAGKTTTAINLSLIAITFPVFIIILSRFIYKEPITKRRVIGLLIVCIGVIVVLTKGELSLLMGLSFHQGDFWMLLAAFSFAIYSLLLKQKPDNLNIISFQYSIFTVGLFMLFPFFIIENMRIPDIQYTSKSIYSFIYIGICASLLAFVFWNKSIALIGPTKSGMIYYTLPLFSGVLAFLLLDESLKAAHLISALLIVSGILLSNYKRK